ncbi:hypothetical protein FRX31_025834 [Thalictrum thalictroides]|uniref:Uncharacterized protein n=1 Tax=Thalictrum thalictroides TaxID=46969 RepID=A0A7J6VJU4_THATH|nr:hypothetical protein FRX31_025834 [Thalictrum thalictroides]
MTNQDGTRPDNVAGTNPQAISQKSPSPMFSLLFEIARVVWMGQEHQEGVFVRIQTWQSTYVKSRLSCLSIDPPTRYSSRLPLGKKCPSSIATCFKLLFL